ncbi:MAG: hypothetical protein LHV68_13030 [Elusimicrobia bacterium]|nr:hypothetical protein [Candidatus Liberimonas magnetica]
MSKQEEQLYPEIEEWFKGYLKDRYPKYEIITTYKTSRITLDSYLKTLKIDLNVAVGLAIKVDIVAVLRKGEEIKLAFVEVKDGPLTLPALGQLWGYTQLISPVESFLISSKSLGRLPHLFNILKREDLLVYGLKKERIMKIAKWDTTKKSIDYFSLIPKK